MLGRYQTMKTPIALMLVLAAATAAIAFAVPSRDGAVIVNSGSTNAAGYTIKIWSDGNAAAQRTGMAATTPSHVTMTLVTRLFADAKQAKQAGRVPHPMCMKSASFGTTTHVTYHGWTSADLECPGGGALAEDVHAIVQAVALPAVNRRPLLPNEPRRPESVPVQPTASPDSGRPMP